MSRDKHADPRKEARERLQRGDSPTNPRRAGDVEEAAVWGLLHVGDAIHRLAKASEARLNPDRVEANRHRRREDEPKT